MFGSIIILILALSGIMPSNTVEALHASSIDPLRYWYLMPLLNNSNTYINYSRSSIVYMTRINAAGNENLFYKPELRNAAQRWQTGTLSLRYNKIDFEKSKRFDACLGDLCFYESVYYSYDLSDLCATPIPDFVLGPVGRRFRRHADGACNEIKPCCDNLKKPHPKSYRHYEFHDWNKIIFAKTRYDRPKEHPVPEIDSPCINARKDYFENEYNYIKNERKNGISYIYDPLDNYDFDFVRKWFYLFELSPKYDLDFPDYLSIDDAGYARPSRKFWVSPYPVTQSEFRRLMGFNPSYFVSCGGNCPAENLTWHQAIAYANAKSRAEQLETCYVMNQCNRRFASCKDVSFKGLDCRGYRLMTDEEWRWLAKQDYLNTTANADLRHNNGEDYAWTMRNSKVSYFGCIREKCYGLRSCLNNLNVLKDGCFGTHPAGTRKPISLGLHDFYGNVGTWVWDWHGFASKSGDSLGPDFGFCKIVRGTNFFTNEGSHDSRARHCYPPDKGSGLIGARLVRTQDGWIDDKDIE